MIEGSGPVHRPGKSEAVARRLAEAGLALPQAPAARGDYLPARMAGALVFTSGQLPLVSGTLHASGRLGDEVTPETGRECARIAALNALAAAAAACALDDVEAAVKLVGYVASSPGFIGQPAVMDAASEVLAVAFGPSGVHAREAVGVASLPMGAPVELSLVLLLGAPATVR